MSPLTPEITPIHYIMTAKRNLQGVFGGKCFVQSIELVYKDEPKSWLIRLSEPCKPSRYLGFTATYRGRNVTEPTYHVEIAQGKTSLFCFRVSQADFMKALITGSYEHFHLAIYIDATGNRQVIN